MRSALLDLARRCESETGANFALESEIADAFWQSQWGRKRPRDIKPMAVTASIDQALRLLPEGHAWHISSGGRRAAYATIESGDDRIEDYHATAETPALALTAVALRVIAADVAP